METGEASAPLDRGADTITEPNGLPRNGKLEGQGGRAILFGSNTADTEKALRVARSAYDMAAVRRSRSSLG